MALSAAGLPPVAASSLVAGLSALAAGGGLGDALLSAAFAAAAAGLSKWVGGRGLGRFQAHAAHGLAQGGVSRLAGGSFRAGFWGGSVGHWAGGGVMSLGGAGSMHVAGRTALAAMAGGAAAELGGGKFENGAVSAAFAHLFNNESDAKQDKAQKLELTPEQEQELRALLCGGPDRPCPNPTGGVARKTDVKGDGAFWSSRKKKDGTRRKHLGLDVAAVPGQDVLSATSGRVNKTGFVYDGNTNLQYVEIAFPDLESGSQHLLRSLYVDPSVEAGTEVKAGQVIGTAQSLQKAHQGITEHVHIQIQAPNGKWVDPAALLFP